ncbi:MAG: protein kinase, partial [Dehalococcoidia bacterium]
DFEKNLDGVWDAVIYEGRRAEKGADLQVALKCADMCTRLKPEYAVSYAWRGQLRSFLGEFQLAIEDAKKCLRLDPTYEKAKLVIRDAEIAINQCGPASFEDRKPSPAAGISPQNPTPRSANTDVVTMRKPASPSTSVLEDRTAEKDRGSYLWNVGDLAFERFLVRRIVSGGMGDVYLCWDQKSAGPVALKAVKLDTPGAVSEDGESAFRCEAEHWFRLPRHPNVVTLYTVEEYQFRQLVLAMEYIAGVPEIGPTLHDHLRVKERLPVDEAVRAAVGICRAMEFVHSKARLVHRDLKPANIFIASSGLAKVGDFGLAATDGTIPPSLAGTREYMAPEQFEPGESVAVGMDIYATGVIMYEMLSGVRPIPPDGETAVGHAGWAYHHAHSRPRPLVERCSGAPPALCEVVMRCLAKDPKHRPRSFSELRERLSASVPGDGATIDEAAHSTPTVVPSSDAFDRGVSANALGYHDEALQAYKEATASEPFKSARSEAWCNMGKVLGTLRRYPEALESFERAL